MHFTKTEKQLLTVIYGLLHNNYPASRQMIDLGGKSFFQSGFAVKDEDFTSLLKAGFLYHENEEYRLTSSGEMAAADAMHSAMDEGSDKGIAIYADSKAYHTFCADLFGIDLCQLNMLSDKQLTKILDFLQIRQEHYVLELGCGNGFLTEYLAEQTGAFVLGIDSASDAVEQALQRTAGKRNSVDFISRDLNIPFASSRQFDAVIAIDSLAESADLEKVVANLKNLTVTGGRMAFMHSERVDIADIPKQGLADLTTLAQVLKKLNIDYQAIEFSEEEYVLWNNILEIKDHHLPDFLAEDHPELLTRLTEQAETVLKTFDLQRVRFLYQCTK